MHASLLERHADKIHGVLGCYDRILLRGTLPGLCFPEGMSAHLWKRGIRIFDYPRAFTTCRDGIIENAKRLAGEHGFEIEFMRKSSFRKDDRIEAVLKERGHAPGLVYILSAMEACPSYRPWHDKKTGRTFLKPVQGKCLHFYFYFLDAEIGLCYVRVPTWAPFGLQFYFNGHNHLASKLRTAGVEFQMLDNAFLQVADLAKAQVLADEIDIAKVHAALDRYAALCCPASAILKIPAERRYHWSIMQIEYSTDVMFKRQADLAPIYDVISRTAIHAVKAKNVATFLGRRLTVRYEGEMGNSFSTRIEGTRIKHVMGPVSVKMYDKRGIILRIETTANNVSFFQHHRKVEQKNGEVVHKLARLKKSIYSLGDLRGLMAAANRRYLEFISALEDPSAGTKALQKIAEPTEENGRNYRGFNFFSATDDLVLSAMARGEFTISGFRNKDLQEHMPEKKPAWISRALKRLRVHGLIKRIGKSYKHYPTELGRRLVLTALKLREMVIIPALAQPSRVLATT
jgi:hypothetical protein